MITRYVKRSLIMAACAATVVTGTRAATILDVSLSDPYSVGESIPRVIGLAGGQAAESQYMVSQLAGMALNSTTGPINVSGASDNPIVFNRSGNFSSPLPSATTIGAVLASGGGMSFVTLNNANYVSIDLGSTGYGYLVGAYDGTQAGAEVWDISGLSGTIYIPEYAYLSGGHLATGPAPGTTDQYQITSWTLMNPVPDGGLTIALLGFALVGLGLIRRKLGFAV